MVKPLLAILLSGLLGCNPHDEDLEQDAGESGPVLVGDPHLQVTIALQADWDPEVVGTTLCRRAVDRYWTARREGDPDGGEVEYTMWPPDSAVFTNERIHRLAARLRQDPWVVSVTPVYPELGGVDPGSQGDLPTDDQEWHLGPLGINAKAAWQLFADKGKEPGEGIVIGLTDTGYLEHPELFFAEGDTQLLLPLQKNFIADESPDDAHDSCEALCAEELAGIGRRLNLGHGSLTAGLMVSPSGQQAGTVGNFYARGAVPGAGVIPVRVSASTVLDETTMHSLAEGIRYERENGATVISISLGGVASDDAALRQAIKDVTSSGVIVVAAAGNMPVGTELGYEVVSKPASYPETIAVGGATAEQVYWKETNRGPEVDISAPARDVRIARPGMLSETAWLYDTGLGLGTSLSTALIASVAALWQSYHGYPELLAHYGNDAAKIPQAFRQILKSDGFRRPDDWDTSLFGIGIVDAEELLRAPLPNL